MNTGLCRVGPQRDPALSVLLDMYCTCTASTTMRAKKSESEPTILEDMAVLAAFTSVSLPSEDVSIARLSSMYLHACPCTPLFRPHHEPLRPLGMRSLTGARAKAA